MLSRLKSRRRMAIIAMAGLVALVVSVFALLAARPDVREWSGSSFELCGDSYRIHDGYLAFDYGSRDNAEVPDGHLIIRVRSAVEGGQPPRTVNEAFATWPSVVSALVINEAYESWRVGLDTGVEGRTSTAGTYLGDVEYADGCQVGVSLRDGVGVPLPRPDVTRARPGQKPRSPRRGGSAA